MSFIGSAGEGKGFGREVAERGNRDLAGIVGIDGLVGLIGADRVMVDAGLIRAGLFVGGGRWTLSSRPGSGRADGATGAIGLRKSGSSNSSRAGCLVLTPFRGGTHR